MKLELYPFQKKDLERLRKSNYTGLLAIEAGGGKALRSSEVVLRSDGRWVRIDSLKAGDEVMGSRGPTKVLGVYPQGVREIVKITMTDGATVECDWDHLWTFQDTNNKTRGTYRTMTTREIWERGLHRNGRRAVALPMPEPVALPERKLDIDPYVLGALLGDGGMTQRTVKLTTQTHVVEKVAEVEKNLTRNWLDGSEGVEDVTVRGDMRRRLEELGLMGCSSLQKFIPEDFLTASLDQRIALFQGLMDTDGWVSKTKVTGTRKAKGSPVFSTSSLRLARDMQTLVHSLGGSTSVTSKTPTYTYQGEKHTGARAYSVRMKLHPRVEPFTVPHKKETYVPVTSYRPSRYMETLEVVGEDHATCIKVDAEDSLFITRDYLLTHNTLLACEVINELGPEQTLIIAPKSTISRKTRNWPAAVRDQCGQELKVIGRGTKAERNNLTEFELGVPGVYASTPAFATRKTTDTSSWQGDLLIVDEAHQVATPRSSGQRRISGFYRHDEPLATRFSHRIALSGTPLRQNFSNAWATMRLLWPELSGYGEVACDNYWVWAEDRMHKKTVYTSQKDRDGNPKTATQFVGEKFPGLLVTEAPCVIVHKRREECCEFHPNGFLTTEAPQEIERVVDLTPVQRKAIKELENHFMTFLEDNPLVTKLTITQRQRIKQICLGEPIVEYWEDADGEERSTLEFEDDCVSPFADETIEILEQHIPEDEPVVIFLESQRFASVLVKKLNKAGIRAEEYSGVSKADLDGLGKDYRVLVGQVTSIGTGTDGLGRVAVNEIWLETPVSITTETQAQARLDRMGSRGQVQRWLVKDSMGYADGRLSDNIEKRLEVNKSMKVQN